MRENSCNVETSRTLDVLNKISPFFFRVAIVTMKNEFGAWTSFLSLCLRASEAGEGFKRSWARTWMLVLDCKVWEWKYHDELMGMRESEVGILYEMMCGVYSMKFEVETIGWLRNVCVTVKFSNPKEIDVRSSLQSPHRILWISCLQSYSGAFFTLKIL